MENTDYWRFKSVFKLFKCEVWFKLLFPDQSEVSVISNAFIILPNVNKPVVFSDLFTGFRLKLFIIPFSRMTQLFSKWQIRTDGVPDVAEDVVINVRKKWLR